MTTLRQVLMVLDGLGLIIEKTIDELPDEDKTHIIYTIIDTTSLTDPSIARLSIYISNIDEEEIIDKLDEDQKQKFKKIKKTPLYCYIAWINGSRSYKNLGKFIMFYMMLDLSQKHKFIIKLDNSSGKPNTYKFFGFERCNDDEEEIMSSVLLSKIKKNMSSITIEK